MVVYGGTAIRFCPAHASHPLTVLCFSLQKSLASSLSRPFLFPFRKLVQVDPWFSSVSRSLFTCTTAAPQSYMRATWVTLHPTISCLKIPYPPILLAPLYGCEFAGPRIPVPSLALPSSSSPAPSSTWPRSLSSNMDGQPPGYHSWAPTALSSTN